MIKVKIVPLDMRDRSDEFLANRIFIIGGRIDHDNPNVSNPYYVSTDRYGIQCSYEYHKDKEIQTQVRDEISRLVSKLMSEIK